MLQFKQRLECLSKPKNITEAIDILFPDRIANKNSKHSISISKNTNLFFKKKQVEIIKKNTLNDYYNTITNKSILIFIV